MIRRWIVNNFFSDIVNEESSKFHKSLIEEVLKLRKENSQLRYPSIKKLTDHLRGRIFTKEEAEKIKFILDAGTMMR